MIQWIGLVVTAVLGSDSIERIYVTKALLSLPSKVSTTDEVPNWLADSLCCWQTRRSLGLL